MTYYREEGRRIRIRVEKKTFTSTELNIRYCFKARIFPVLWLLAVWYIVKSVWKLPYEKQFSFYPKGVYIWNKSSM